MHGASLRFVEYLSDFDDVDQQRYGGETVIAWDLMGAGDGQRVAIAEGPEAAAPFRPDTVPVDASIVALLDGFD